MNRQELQESKCPECGSVPPCWRKIDDLSDWGDLGEGTRWWCENCDAYLIIRPWDPNEEISLPIDAWNLAVDLLKRSISEEGLTDSLVVDIAQFLTRIETEKRHG